MRHQEKKLRKKNIDNHSTNFKNLRLQLNETSEKKAEASLHRI